jgi:putative ABC transport system permease protein
VLLAAYDRTGRNADDAAARAFASRLLDRLRAVPGIEAAAISTQIPLDIHGLPLRSLVIEGHARADGALDQALSNTVTPGYWPVMGIPLIAGTDFAPLTDQAPPRQAIVNEEFVRRYLSGVEPLGRRVEYRERPYVIAGVARNSLYESFGEPTPIIYFSYRDRPSTAGEIHVRTHPGAEIAVASDVRRVVREIDETLSMTCARSQSTSSGTCFCAGCRRACSWCSGRCCWLWPPSVSMRLSPTAWRSGPPRSVSAWRLVHQDGRSSWPSCGTRCEASRSVQSQGGWSCT